MVTYQREKGNTIIFWYDGSIPQKRNLIIKQIAGMQNPARQAVHFEHLNRENLFGQYLSSKIEEHIEAHRLRSKRFQIIISRADSFRHQKSIAMLRAENRLYDFGRYFPEDDKIMSTMPASDILKVLPNVRGMKQKEYFQIIALYPASGQDWRWDPISNETERSDSPLERILDDFGLVSLNRNCYRNYPLFEQSLSIILNELVTSFNQGNSIARNLAAYRFDPIVNIYQEMI